MRWLRAAVGLLAAVATAAGLTVPAPGVLGVAAATGAVAFVLCAGCLAADCVPWRPLHAGCSAASVAVAVVLAVGGRAAGVPVAAPAALLLVLQVLPAAAARRAEVVR